jgi:hypothetical protein
MPVLPTGTTQKIEVSHTEVPGMEAKSLTVACSIKYLGWRIPEEKN